jgi:hypothetical protein
MSAKRTRAQRRWKRKGVTGEVTYWSGRGEPWNFILVLAPESYAYFRKHRLPDDWIRPICPVFFHNGGRPR